MIDTSQIYVIFKDETIETLYKKKKEKNIKKTHLNNTNELHFLNKIYQVDESKYFNKTGIYLSTKQNNLARQFCYSN